MIVFFCTAHKGDGTGPSTDYKVIALAYIKSPTFYIDLIGSFPTLLTVYSEYGFYYFKILRYFDLKRANTVIRHFVEKLENLNVKKHTLIKGAYLLQLLLAMMLVMHLIACAWLSIGENIEGSWISNVENGIGKDQDDHYKYITSIYWVMTTLTTVGYGDFKGYTSQEYGFTMAVEFMGILIFSIMMGFINDIFVGGEEDDDDKLDMVDKWLVNLDNSRMSK